MNKIADFLREKGYNCHPSPAIGGAQDANLGCIGKNGVLITPEFGPCVRLAAIFIDVDNLLIAKENEHMWIAEFCKTCNSCVKACPAGAIYEEPKILAESLYRFREVCSTLFRRLFNLH
ncbi:MAG: hypothetical protein JM58_15135 [Peptococcaceae bacterium BICA1-8]|nr:MAG: hypothetical protein JM58_15135 [Peptococcaceae bacterium BICA1-8]